MVVSRNQDIDKQNNIDKFEHVNSLVLLNCIVKYNFSVMHLAAGTILRLGFQPLCADYAKYG